MAWKGMKEKSRSLHWNAFFHIYIFPVFQDQKSKYLILCCNHLRNSCFIWKNLYNSYFANQNPSYNWLKAKGQATSKHCEVEIFTNVLRDCSPQVSLLSLNLFHSGAPLQYATMIYISGRWGLFILHWCLMKNLWSNQFLTSPINR